LQKNNMAILTTINGIPLYDSPQEALAWGSQYNLQGFHTHIYQGVVGYMAGINHNNAVTGSGQITSSNGGSSYSSGGSSGGGGGGY
tara:strand:- start:144 stop:401 length:258 start_codon:yes stop_codon:yes gene_type:complete